jgi:nitrate reductase alpha subunit
MIVMGAGTNHWFHSDTIYRAFLALTTLTGCQGVNGGGWAHYVGQEKCRPFTGWAQLAFGLDWSRPPRQMIQTAYWYLHTDQFRYDQFGADTLSARTGEGPMAGRTTAEPQLLRAMDRSDSAPGFSLLEDVCGTNGLGSVVEEREVHICERPPVASLSS